MDQTTCKTWLEAYGHAWTARDALAATKLYTDDAIYQVTPFSEPIRGRSAIHEYWVGVTNSEQDIQFDYEILAITTERGIARWWASFAIIPHHLETKLDGIFLISLGPQGRCQSLCEWWQEATVTLNSPQKRRF